MSLPDLAVLAAPKVTATQLRAVLATDEGVLVHLPTGDTEAAPEGLTKRQALDASIVVVLDAREARSFLVAADGDTEAARYTAAARAASAVIGWRYAQEVTA